LEKVLVGEAWQQYHQHIAERQIDKALEVVKGLIVFCNRRIEEQKPWSMAKEEARRQELDELLYELMEIIRQVSAMLLPAMPGVIGKVHEVVFTELPNEVRMSSEWGKTTPGMKLPEEGVILFPRLES
jgi:methionyl-tRNA synthetase